MLFVFAFVLPRFTFVLAFVFSPYFFLFYCFVFALGSGQGSKRSCVVRACVRARDRSFVCVIWVFARFPGVCALAWIVCVQVCVCFVSLCVVYVLIFVFVFILVLFFLVFYWSCIFFCLYVLWFCVLFVHAVVIYKWYDCLVIGN